MTMLELKEIKRLHEKAYVHNQITRERAADDLVFYWITQWDENILNDSQLAYKGEFNVLRKAGRQIMSDLMANPVQVDFEPLGDTTEESQEILDGLYRTDDAENSSIESYEIASQETVVCGFGSWELCTEYESMKSENSTQVIKRYPINEANNVVFWDPQSKLRDRSDAKFCSVITRYTEEGLESLRESLKGSGDLSAYRSNFAQPEQSYTFPWIGTRTHNYYIVKFYHKTLVKDKLITFIDPVGQQAVFKESSLVNVMDDLLDAGYSVESSKEIQRFEVTKYIVSGIEILDASKIAGEHIPIVSMYGEHAVVEGEDHWEGITKLTKDPSRLRNFAFSYLADILSKSPRRKPIFFQEQIAGYENMYRDTGIENNFPYLLQNRLANDGEELPIGPVSEMPEQGMPTALPAVIELTKVSVEDVANPGLPQDVADPDTSGKAVLALQTRIDMQSLVYQEHLKHAKRYDGVVYASMSVDVQDVPRKVILTQPDGTRKKVQMYDTIIDKETGDVVTLNSLMNAEFKVFSSIGPSYNSQREQTTDKILNMLATVSPDSPIHQALLLKLLKLTDGVDFDDIREYANMQLVLLGIRKPQSPEEEQALKEHLAKQNEDSPELVLAKAEALKGQADIIEAETEKLQTNLEAQNEKMKRQIDAFEAITQRMGVQVNAQKAKADIDNKASDTLSKTIDNASNVINFKQADMQPQNTEQEDFSKMSDEELFAQLTG